MLAMPKSAKDVVGLAAFTGTSGPTCQQEHDFKEEAGLEAQQRHFSYRAILIAMVSQNSLSGGSQKGGFPDLCHFQAIPDKFN